MVAAGHIFVVGRTETIHDRSFGGHDLGHLTRDDRYVLPLFDVLDLTCEHHKRLLVVRMYQQQVPWVLELQSQFSLGHELAVHGLYVGHAVLGRVREHRILQRHVVRVIRLFGHHTRSERTSLPVRLVHAMQFRRTYNQHVRGSHCLQANRALITINTDDGVLLISVDKL